MKQFKTILLATALCLGTISFTQAQSKVAQSEVAQRVVFSSNPSMKKPLSTE